MNAIVLAGGKGSRMNLDIPKCACLLDNKPMINYLIETLKKMNIENIYIVVGYYKEKIIEIVNEKVVFVVQKEQLGTAHAVRCCEEELKKNDGETLILAGDMPLVSKDLLNNFMNYHIEKKNDLTILSTIMENPTGMGRVIRNEKNQVIKIVEEAEADEKIKQITEINTSIYCINNQVLFQNIKRIKNNNQQKEYYLTDIVEILSKNKKIETYVVPYSYKLMGINDIATLKKVEKMMEEENVGAN